MLVTSILLGKTSDNRSGGVLRTLENPASDKVCVSSRLPWLLSKAPRNFFTPASKFGEWQRHDLRRQGQPDITGVDDKPRSRLFAEVFLEGPNPPCHRRAVRGGKLHFNRDQ